MAEPVRKRRKWDVAAPQGVPVAAGQGLSASGVSPAAGVGLTSVVQQSSVPGQTAAVQASTPAAAPLADVRPQQPNSDAIARAQQSAAAVLEKINRDLVAQGRAPLRGGGFGGAPAEEPPEIARDVTINDAPPQTRYTLTKRTTQEEIQRRTATVIVNRGRYHAPGGPPDEKEKPLHLHITPAATLPPDLSMRQRAVDAAAAEIEAMLQGHPLRRGPGLPLASFQSVPPPGQVRPPAAPSFQPAGVPGVIPAAYAVHGAGGGGAAPGGAHSVQLPIDFNAPPEFNLPARIRGANESYLQHIAKETKSMVLLRGLGSGLMEHLGPMHVHIASQDAKGLEEAKRLAQNLLDTIRSDFRRMYPHLAASPPPATAAGPSPPVLGHMTPPGGYGTPPPGSYPPPSQPAYAPLPGQAPPPHPAGYPYGASPPSAYGQPPALGSGGYLPPYGAPAPYGGPPGGYPPGAAPYGAPPRPGGYGAPPPQQQPAAGAGPPQQGQAPAVGAGGAPPAAGYGAPPYGAPGQPPPYGAPYTYPAYGGYPPSGQQPPPYGQAPPPYGQPGQQPAPQQTAQPQQQQQQQAGGAQPGGGSAAPQQNGTQEQQQPQRRRFKEFKEEAPVAAAQVPQNPYVQQQQQQQQHPQPQQQNGPQASMGPPPPRPPQQAGAMGPPPPRAPGAMGPPPPRGLVQNPDAGRVQVSGGGGLVDY